MCSHFITPQNTVIVLCRPAGADWSQMAWNGKLKPSKKDFAEGWTGEYSKSVLGDHALELIRIMKSADVFPWQAPAVAFFYSSVYLWSPGNTGCHHLHLFAIQLAQQSMAAGDSEGIITSLLLHHAPVSLSNHVSVTQDQYDNSLQDQLHAYKQQIQPSKDWPIFLFIYFFACVSSSLYLYLY